MVAMNNLSSFLMVFIGTLGFATAAPLKNEIFIDNTQVDLTTEIIGDAKFKSVYSAKVLLPTSKFSEHFTLFQIKSCKDLGKPIVAIEKVAWSPMAEKNAPTLKARTAETVWACLVKNGKDLETQVSIEKNICEITQQLAVKELCKK